ncbi:hypothetical protein Slin15195_G001000 [Septoria linicola]|uniref:Nephrocystin 3-like N-terminal domain-containing protein n=1 Tax=Septoria linicola TaxID=215465 RepID=A0A9Q9AL24_9PEZI|nr:hypothetical protein Slin15195_G001000 [Septoria linicola]
MKAHQAQSLSDFVNLSVQLLSIVRKRRYQATSSGLHKAVELHGAFDDILKKLEGIEQSLGTQASPAVIQQVQNIVRDVLLRLDLLQAPPMSLNHLGENELLARVWSDESLIRLESCLPMVQSVVQSDTTTSFNVGIRRLWTGSGQFERHLSPTDADSPMTELLGSSAVAEDPTLTDEVNKTLADPDKTELIQGAYLQGLKFAAMNDREEEVTDAHERTLEWILDESTTSDSAPLISEADNFVPWLSGDSAAHMYWVNGKAGSGKSTLMRFLASHDKTARYLSSWAAGLPLTVARFFFWTSGTALQRSQNGLLRALLFEILDHDPSLIP